MEGKWQRVSFLLFASNFSPGDRHQMTKLAGMGNHERYKANRPVWPAIGTFIYACKNSVIDTLYICTIYCEFEDRDHRRDARKG